jgi:hypothetical protein
MRARAFAVALVASAALLAAGCGKNDQPTAAEWTDDLCSAITTWQSSITSIVTSLQSNGLTKDSLTSAFDDAKTATNELTSTLGDLGKPDSESGQQAQDAVDQLSSEISSDIQTIQDAVENASGVSGFLNAAQVTKDTITKAGTQVSSTITTLQGIGAQDEFKSAFADSSSCQKLSGGS